MIIFIGLIDSMRKAEMPEDSLKYWKVLFSRTYPVNGGLEHARSIKNRDWKAFF